MLHCVKRLQVNKIDTSYISQRAPIGHGPLGKIYERSTSWSTYCSMPLFVEECDRAEYKRKLLWITHGSILSDFYLKNICSKTCSWIK